MKTTLTIIFAVFALGAVYTSEQFDHDADLTRQAEMDGGRF